MYKKLLQNNLNISYFITALFLVLKNYLLFCQFYTKSFVLTIVKAFTGRYQLER